MQQADKDYAEGLRLFYLNDYDAALPLLTRSAEAGCVKAQHFLALMYQNGNGVAQDFEKAAFWYEKTARQGDSEAQLTYAMILALGKGTQSDIAAACHWATESYHHGNDRAWQTLQIVRAEAKAEAAAAVEAFRAAHLARDDGAALAQLERAAECGDADAQFALARLLADKEDASSREAAVLWLRDAAMQGHEASKHLLAELTAERGESEA